MITTGPGPAFTISYISLGIQNSAYEEPIPPVRQHWGSNFGKSSSRTGSRSRQALRSRHSQSYSQPSSSEARLVQRGPGEGDAGWPMGSVNTVKLAIVHPG